MIEEGIHRPEEVVLVAVQETKTKSYFERRDSLQLRSAQQYPATLICGVRYCFLHNIL